MELTIVAPVLNRQIVLTYEKEGVPSLEDFDGLETLEHCMYETEIGTETV